MSSELFVRYRGISHRDAPVAAVQVEKIKIMKLSQLTGGTAVMKKMRGGSMTYSEIILHGMSVKIGDYIIADAYDSFRGVKKEDFEERYILAGPLSSTERR